jgi:periplasmic protein TonB
MRESQSLPSPVFLWSLAASITFHALALLALDIALHHTMREPQVDFIAARLELRAPRGAADVAIPPRVVKNTLDSGRPRPRSPVAPPPPESAERDGLRAARPGRAEALAPEQLDVALGRLSETLLYPPEAVRQGLEGEVVVLLELGEDGRIMQAAVAGGSGYALLDEAALRAVQQLGGLGPSLANRAILLPVRFKIR